MLDESKSGSYLRQKTHKAQIESSFCSMHSWKLRFWSWKWNTVPFLYSFVTLHKNVQNLDTHGLCRRSSFLQGCREEPGRSRFSRSLWRNRHHAETAGQELFVTCHRRLIQLMSSLSYSTSSYSTDQSLWSLRSLWRNPHHAETAGHICFSRSRSSFHNNW